MIAPMASRGPRGEALSCRLLEVTRAGYYGFLGRPPSARAIRNAWLIDLITEVHAASRGTYGSPRVAAELRMGRGIIVGRNSVAMLMRRAGLRGQLARGRWRARADTPTIADLGRRLREAVARRRFARGSPDWYLANDALRTASVP